MPATGEPPDKHPCPEIPDKTSENVSGNDTEIDPHFSESKDDTEQVGKEDDEDQGPENVDNKRGKTVPGPLEDRRGEHTQGYEGIKEAHSMKEEKKARDKESALR